MAKKLSPTKQWMADRPDDKPCPLEPYAARAWRRKRGLDFDPEWLALRAKYEQAMRDCGKWPINNGDDPPEAA
jgi:hypothetical protein